MALTSRGVKKDARPLHKPSRRSIPDKRSQQHTEPWQSWSGFAIDSFIARQRGELAGPQAQFPTLTLGLPEIREMPEGLAQILVEEIDGPPPGQLGSRFVVPWGRIVMESVIGAVIHVRRVGHAGCLESCLVSRPSSVKARVEGSIVKQERRFDLGGIRGWWLSAIEGNRRGKVRSHPHGQRVGDPAAKAEANHADL